MRVEYLSFSAHADARGIMQLISQCRPGHVLLVHGEASKMEFLKGRIESETGLECSMPANGEIAEVPTRPNYQLYAPAEVVNKALGMYALHVMIFIDHGQSFFPISLCYAILFNKLLPFMATAQVNRFHFLK